MKNSKQVKSQTLDSKINSNEDLEIPRAKGGDINLT